MESKKAEKVFLSLFLTVLRLLLFAVGIFHILHNSSTVCAQNFADDPYYYNYSNSPEGYGGGEYLSDWNNQDWTKHNGRLQQPKCVDIPADLTLCRDIGYARMMLPNLLDHDSLLEVVHQAASWVPLVRINCHPDARVFLCSLFSPVCLDRLIYPCR